MRIGFYEDFFFSKIFWRGTSSGKGVRQNKIERDDDRILLFLLCFFYQNRDGRSSRTNRGAKLPPMTEEQVVLGSNPSHSLSTLASAVVFVPVQIWC